MTVEAPNAWYRMKPLELATGMVRGVDPSTPPLPVAPIGLTARAALENAVLPALRRPPCVVSFSGGRDSSTVLAVATHVARREGLLDPVPVSVRFPGHDGANEDSWQELVVRHLGLPDWARLEWDDELDLIGPYARAVMERHGQLWPLNVHFHLPIVERAAGGAVISGFGGDELFTPSTQWRRVNGVLTGKLRWQIRDVPRVAVAHGPRSLKRWATRRRLGDETPRSWLRPEPHARVIAEVVDDLASEPVRWDVAVDRAWWRRRYRSVFLASHGRVAQMHAVRAVDPLVDGVFLSAFAREGGRCGFPTRAEAMAHLAGDLLPEQVLARSSKAELGGAFWNRHSIAFAAAWDGTGVDPDIVDVDVLRRMWTTPDRVPDGRSLSLFQSAWLAAQGVHTSR